MATRRPVDIGAGASIASRGMRQFSLLARAAMASCSRLRMRGTLAAPASRMPAPSETPALAVAVLAVAVLTVAVPAVAVLTVAVLAVAVLAVAVLAVAGPAVAGPAAATGVSAPRA